MPEVTALRDDNAGLVAVELDGVAWRVLPLGVVARIGLTVGRALTGADLAALDEELRRSHAFERAAKLLARRDLSVRRLDERLAADGIGAAHRREALGALAGGGYLDDSRLAASRVSVLAERGAGDAAIRADLERLGIGQEESERALESVLPENERARRIVAERGRTPAAARYLLRRGFSSDTVETLFADLVA